MTSMKDTRTTERQLPKGGHKLDELETDLIIKHKILSIFIVFFVNIVYRTCTVTLKE
jgi:hypothetical protein